MVGSALVMALLGLVVSFFPQEIINTAGAGPSGTLVLFLQVLGAQYIAFGMVNWMTRESILGGIYGRPIVMGNSIHFTIGAVVLLKGLIAHSSTITLWVVCGIYCLLALLFSAKLFRHPVSSVQ
jgi:hypothetical protein